jgi:hypothetical protein
MNAGWIEPVAEHAVLASGARLDGVQEPARQDRPERSGAAARRFWLVLALAVAAMIGAAALSRLLHQDSEAPAVATGAAPPADDYRESDLPPLLFVKSLDGGRATAAYQAQVRDSDGARKDALTLGDPSSDRPFLLASLRIGRASQRPSLFFVELARQAAEVGQAVARASAPDIDAAAGGAALYSEVTLEAGGRERACLGFRFAGTGAVDLSGIACGGVDQPLERDSLECLISRLAATPAGSTAGLDPVLTRVGEKPSC